MQSSITCLVPPCFVLLTVNNIGLAPFAPCSTNSSYGRWDESRKMWGLVVNRSRDFVRQVRAQLA